MNTSSNALPTDPADLGAAPLSLAHGALGIALAHQGQGSPAAVTHAWLSAAVAAGITDDTGRAGLFHGLPAVAFVLSHTPTDHYQHARSAVREHLHALTRRRLQAAHARIDRGAFSAFAEYDLISGLTGIGVALRSFDPDGALLEEVLAYLVRLTRPMSREGRSHPGWWVLHGLQGKPSPSFPNGHANTGMAHGIGGVLSALALTYREGLIVPGHREAIERLCAALDECQRNDRAGTWWPGWISPDQPHAFDEPGAPSWCYGTPGLARAQQLAALALGDDLRLLKAELSMEACISAPEQLRRLTSAGLCHGSAGVLQVVARMGEDQDARPGRLRLDRHIPTLRELVTTAPLPPPGSGLLEGHAGIALSLATRQHSAHERWDRCLLIA